VGGMWTIGDLWKKKINKWIPFILVRGDYGGIGGRVVCWKK